MSDAQAGTPPSPDDRKEAGTPGTGQDGSELNAQQKSEWMAWKQKAEHYNRLEQELAAEKARAQELERIAYGGGARQATDPRAALVAQASEQAQYDPIAQLALQNTRDNMEMKAELWLSNQLLAVPPAKQAQVAALIRNAGYQMDANYALGLVTDPEAKTLHEQLATTRAELERLKGAKPNGYSPASAVPATASADDGPAPEKIPRAEYLQVVSRGSQKDATDADRERARALMRAVASGKSNLED
jgi:hypothetical protein